MLKYTLHVHIEGEDTILINVEPETEYILRTNITGIGTNGITKNIEDDNFVYYPPHKIKKIEAFVNKD